MRVEKLPARIWEPAAGRGAIVRVPRNHNHNVVASDVHDYGALDFVGDFLAQDGMLVGCEAIVTNPPFKIAEPFASVRSSSRRWWSCCYGLRSSRASAGATSLRTTGSLESTCSANVCP